MSLINCVPYVPSANVPCVLTYSLLTCLACLRAYVSTCLACHVLTRQRALRAYVLTCQRVLRAYVLTCQRALCAYMLTYIACLRANLPTCLTWFCAYVPMCSSAIITNNKNKFSIICFPCIFVIVLSFFFIWNKAVIHFCIALTMRKPLTGAMTDCTIKWFDFCLSITLRVVIKWFIKGERWIIVCGS